MKIHFTVFSSFSTHLSSTASSVKYFSSPHSSCSVLQFAGAGARFPGFTKAVSVGIHITDPKPYPLPGTEVNMLYFPSCYPFYKNIFRITKLMTVTQNIPRLKKNICGNVPGDHGGHQPPPVRREPPLGGAAHHGVDGDEGQAVQVANLESDDDIL